MPSIPKPTTLPSTESPKMDTDPGVDDEAREGVKFDGTEKDEQPAKGNFIHSKPKTRKYHYEDRTRKHDPFFHANIATECETYFQAQAVRDKERRSERFAFIVDLDNYEYHKVVFHNFLNEILQSSTFRVSILLLVLVNAILIGLQTEKSLVEKYSTIFHIMDQVILSVFLIEIIIKWVYDFRLFWMVAWNILDFCIVSLIIVAAVVPVFGNSRALIVVRVVRAFRSLRSVSFLSSLPIVTHTIIKSGADMGNILLVLMIFMVVMSVMGVILFDLPELDTKRFLNAMDAWFVIFICVTQDGWNQVLDEFRNKEYFPLIASYLIFAVSIGAFVFANLIIAVIVANLELSVKELREEKRTFDNPLDSNGALSDPELKILTTFDLFKKNNTILLSQRPMRVPNVKKFSTRRLQAYISLIVALEQNMLESEMIHGDFEKIMGVMLSIILQLDMHATQKAADAEKATTPQDIMEQTMKVDGTVIPIEKSKKMKGTLPAVERGLREMPYLQQMKNRNKT